MFVKGKTLLPEEEGKGNISDSDSNSDDADDEFEDRRRRGLPAFRLPPSALRKKEENGSEVPPPPPPPSRNGERAQKSERLASAGSMVPPPPPRQTGKEAEAKRLEAAKWEVSVTKRARDETLPPVPETYPYSSERLPSWASWSTPDKQRTLELWRENDLIDRMSLDDKVVYVLGRNPDAVDVWMDHDSVSRHHASIMHNKDGELLLEDHDSAQGTELNGKFIPPRVWFPLEDGAEMIFGMCSDVYIVRIKNLPPKPKPKPGSKKRKGPGQSPEPPAKRARGDDPGATKKKLDAAAAAVAANTKSFDLGAFF